MKYMDDGDLLITMPLQVKQRSIDFSCHDDYPYDTIFIDEKYKVKKDTFAYFIVSASGGCAAVIGRETRSHWTTETIYDKHQSRECTNLACPKHLAKFVRITDVR